MDHIIYGFIVGCGIGMILDWTEDYRYDAKRWVKNKLLERKVSKMPMWNKR